MGKIVKFPGGKSDKRPPSNENDSNENLRKQVKELANIIKSKSLLKMAEIKAMPSDFLLEITKEEKLTQLQDAFEISSGTKMSADNRYFSEFLVIRRYILAYIIQLAANNINRADTKTVNNIKEILENLKNIALYNDWDWVSFNELEYDLFMSIANLAKDSKIRFILNRSKQFYLLGVMSFNSQFWNMSDSVKLYTEVWQAIENRNADQARDIFLAFYEKNDKKIINKYEDLVDG